MEYFARTDPRNPTMLPEEPQARWQPLRNHLTAVANLAESFGKAIRPGDKIFEEHLHLIGLVHDVGKYADAFQERLRDAARGHTPQRVEHAVHGALLFEPQFTALALPVLGHHAGLHSPVTIGERRRKNNINPETLGLRNLLLRMIEEFPDLRNVLEPIHHPLMDDALTCEVYIRFLFSVLVDADRRNCIEFAKGQTISRIPFQPSTLLEQLLTHIETLAARQEDSPVKQARADVLRIALEAAENPNEITDSTPGSIHSFEAPTGSGKTFSTMAYGLKRCANRAPEHPTGGIIVVIPFLSIIEQTAKDLREIFGDEAVLEHHSGNLRQGKSEGALSLNDTRHILAEEDWDHPLIVTTSVRFFQTLFSNRTRDARRLHRIANRVVIIDEFQSIPPRLLGPILSMMRELADNWGVEFIISTATKPAVERTAGDNPHLLDPSTVPPILPPVFRDQLYHTLQRVQPVRWPAEDERLTWTALATLATCHPQALLIVNTKNHAAACLDACHSALAANNQSTEHLVHLSTRMCPRHRRDRLKQIKDRLDAGEPCLVVSTQLVEAGVDVDFPVVYREFAPLSAIVQAAGRCDRGGKLSRASGRPAGQFTIFRIQQEDDKSDPALRLYADALANTTTLLRELTRRGETLDIHNPAHIAAYFERLHEDPAKLDREDIQSFRRAHDFLETASHFQLIKGPEHAILVPYGDEGAAFIASIRSEHDLTRKTWRASQQFSVALYPHEFATAHEIGAIQELWPGADIWRALPNSYDETTGFTPHPPSPEATII